MRQYDANLGKLFFLHTANISSSCPISSHDHSLWMQRCISGYYFGVSRVSNIVTNFRHFVRKTECEEDNGWVGIPRLEIILGFHQMPRLPEKQYQWQCCQNHHHPPPIGSSCFPRRVMLNWMGQVPCEWAMLWSLLQFITAPNYKRLYYLI